MEAHSVVDPVAEAALRQFGIPYLFPYQRLVISNVLESIDAHAAGEVEETEDLHDRQIVILPTGAGKSLCFQIPARMRPGLTVVLFPLLSLMADQDRRLRESGFEPALLSGGTDAEAKRKLWRRVAREPGVMLLTNPESTVSPEVRRRLRSVGIAHLVIDEAHCVTDWGESFRPAYRSLASLIEETKPEVVTAFTATASPRIIDDLRKLLFPTGAHLIRADPDRQNISYSLLPTFSKGRSLRLLFDPLRTTTTEPPSPAPDEGGNLPVLSPQRPAPLPSILFCRSRKEAERTARYLRRYLPARRCYFYHAGLSREEKKRIEEWFFSSGDGVLAATCAYGMGVDKKNIRSVIHLRPSSSVESYLQESGRGGRDGNAAQASILLAPSDLERMEAAPESRESSYMWNFLSGSCRRHALLEAMGAENESCSGCDRCNREEVPAELPVRRFRRPWNWPSLTGHGYDTTLCGAFNPTVRELRSFLSPYWEACASWKVEELEEATEERRIARRLDSNGMGVRLFPTEARGRAPGETLRGSDT
ncbi:MAG: RecQ family ATP-dependent DNA helicase [Alkalispirochaetaceae bacterium]